MFLPPIITGRSPSVSTPNRPPIFDSRSISSTSKPDRSSWNAAASPEAPLPTTATRRSVVLPVVTAVLKQRRGRALRSLGSTAPLDVPGKRRQRRGDPRPHLGVGDRPVRTDRASLQRD